MDAFVLFAQPWWVNLLMLIPFAAFWIFRKRKLDLTHKQLLIIFLFGTAFGFVEAAVVVYLRAATAILDVTSFQATQILNGLTETLLTIEVFREVATIIMLISLALLISKRARERWAAFLFAFATWDIFYYVFLWLMIRWPASLSTSDVLFLIPVPWYAQVWFPLIVSLLTIAAVMTN